MENPHAKKITASAKSSTKNYQREVGISNSLQSKPTLVLSGGKLDDTSYIGLAGKNLEPIVSTYSCSLITTASESNEFAAIDRSSVKRTPFSFWVIPEESSRFLLSRWEGQCKRSMGEKDTTYLLSPVQISLCVPIQVPLSHIIFQITLHESRFSHNYCGRGHLPILLHY